MLRNTPKGLFLGFAALVLVLPAAGIAFGGEGAEKAAVPDEAARAKALALVAELYEKPWKEARTSAQKTALAEKMIEAAGRSSDDPLGRFVLLRVARDIAAEAGDAATALRAVDRLDAEFRIDAADMKIAAVLEAAGSAVTVDHHRAIAGETFALVQAAVAKDQYDTAGRLIDAAQSAARKLRDGEAVRAYADLSRDVERIALAYKRTEPHRKTLQQKPTDPEANLAVGRFLCFDKGDWGRGIAMLALGSDEGLAALAKQEVGGPKTAQEQVAVADRWWDRAENADEAAGVQMRLHAGSWYERALPGLPESLVRQKVEARLATLKKPGRAVAIAPPAEAEARGRVRVGQWIDLLKLVDPRRGTVQGNWQRVGGALRATGRARFGLPVEIHGDYDLLVEFQRLEGNDSVSFTLPVGSDGLCLSLGGWGGVASGLERIDGRRAIDSPHSRRPAGIVSGHRYALQIRVRTNDGKASVDVTLDGKPYLAWQGDASSIRLVEGALPNHSQLGLGAYEVPVEFYKVRLRLTSGKADILPEARQEQ